ncbi:hypothetical protein [Providencia sp. PROV152]|uniref:Uncharacterized protein n=1 Tax=Providencia stuartii TaxID=588 RepID=A0AAI9MUZ7_PROST|nr:hypothetical protein [Providencia sp. PROV152]ELR5035288.1 hypothetical protein [Providencia stuartii]
MTNTQLLLLAINNINANIDLSDTQASYVYQFYHTQIAHKNLSIDDFLKQFIEKVEPTLASNSNLCHKSEQIYQLILSYLQQAEARFIYNKTLINKK